MPETWTGAGGPAKATRKCVYCGLDKPKDEQHFYRSGTAGWSRACKGCNTDYVFTQNCRRLAERKGIPALIERMRNLERQVNLAKDVLQKLGGKVSDGEGLL